MTNEYNQNNINIHSLTTFYTYPYSHYDTLQVYFYDVENLLRSVYLIKLFDNVKDTFIINFIFTNDNYITVSVNTFFSS